MLTQNNDIIINPTAMDIANPENAGPSAKSIRNVSK